MLSKTGFRYANYLGEEAKILKEAGKRKHPGVSLCHAVWFLRELMVSEGGEKRRALLQDEQMAESKCGDLFYISISCCGTVDVGFRFPFYLFYFFHLLQDNGCAQCLS